MQQAAPAKPPPPPTMKLDTQEAAAVSGSYLSSLSGQGKAAAPEPVLLVTPQKPNQAQPLAPSVPKER